MDTKLSRVLNQDEGTPPATSCDISISWSRDKSKTLYFHFHKSMDPKLCRVVTQDEGAPSAKSRDTSIVQSRDKSKIFCLHFHKAQGPQTWQGGDQNLKNPPNMSCANSIRLSCDNYLVDSVHLFHFQLKLSPKNRQISNDHDNTEDVQFV